MDPNSPKKLLLIGPGSSGKTSMRSVIFENSTPRDAMRIKLTLSLFQGKVELLHNLALNILDCGSQVDYVLHYLSTQREYVFGNVGVMIFVADIGAFAREGSSVLKISEHMSNVLSSPSDQPSNLDNSTGSSGGGAWPKQPSMAQNMSATEMGSDFREDTLRWNRVDSIQYFVHALSSAVELSPNAQIFVMLHKMDLIKPDAREKVYTDHVRDLKEALANHLRAGCKTKFSELQIKEVVGRVVFFPTTLWDSSVFHAYSVIVRTLVPDREYLDEQLAKLVKQCDGFEAAIFEKRTMLCLAHVDEHGESIETNRVQQTLHEDFEQAEAAETGSTQGSGRQGEDDEDDLDDAHQNGHTTSHHHQHHHSEDDDERHAARKQDSSRANVISEVFKLFKLRCFQRSVDMKSCSMQTPEFSAVLRTLPKTTMVLMVSRDPTVSLALHELNVDAWIRQFSDALTRDPKVKRLASALSMTEPNE